MIEGLIVVLVLSLVSVIISLIGRWGTPGILLIILQAICAVVVAYLLIRVRVKVSRAEKEKLKAKIDELEGKINSMVNK
jgi:membrane protein implicated in regulation of membrane protease activity